DPRPLGCLDAPEPEDHRALVLLDDPHRPRDHPDHDQGRDDEPDECRVDHDSSFSRGDATGSTSSSRRSTEVMRTCWPTRRGVADRADHQLPSTKTCPLSPSAERTVATWPGRTSTPVLREGERA